MSPPYPPRGEQKYDKLGAAGKRLARVPRYGRLIAMLPPGRFDQLKSEAATFWELYSYVAVDPQDDTGLLDDGLKATEARNFGWHVAGSPDRLELAIRRWQVGLARDLLAAIAFQMFCGQDGHGDSGPIFYVDNDLPGFLNRAFDRFESAGAYRSARNNQINGENLWTDWRRLKAMDSHGLRHLVFSGTEERLQFTDVTTQAFFAAYWVCRWGSDADRNLVCEWVPDSLSRANEEYREFWSFVMEMPEEAVDAQRWESLLSPLYDGSLVDERGLPIRSTELMYGSWKRMKDTAAGRKFRGEFGRLLAGEGGDEERVRIARQLVTAADGTSQFLLLGKGERGEGDTGRFKMGAPDGEDAEFDGRGDRQDNPLHCVCLSPYRLHRYCVTNEEYELFDPRHRVDREFEENVGDVSRHPAVNVSWYDAWCSAAWVGEIELDGERYSVELPSEAQWEYACRAGQTTPFTWEEGRSGDRIEWTYCNFDARWPWPESADEGVNRGHTIPVDGEDGDGRRLAANRWGFHQMHGNVWEWCLDWHSAEYYRANAGIAVPVKDPVNVEAGICRVLRGGSWNYEGGGSCRSGIRTPCWPDGSMGIIGFRLAAVPVVSAGGQAGEESERSR